MIGKRSKDFRVIDFREINIEHHSQGFAETEKVPKDAVVIGQTWKYVNKNGTPDKRYKNNYEIPILLYYELTISTSKGLFESYEFSNPEIGKLFCESLANYQNSLKKMNWDTTEIKAIEEDSNS